MNTTPTALSSMPFAISCSRPPLCPDDSRSSSSHTDRPSAASAPLTRFTSAWFACAASRPQSCDRKQWNGVLLPGGAKRLSLQQRLLKLSFQFIQPRDVAQRLVSAA